MIKSIASFAVSSAGQSSSLVVKGGTPVDPGTISDGSDESFSIITMGFGQRLGEAEASSEWEVNFDASARFNIYFGDYLSPFRQFLRTMIGVPAKEQASAIGALTKGTFSICSNHHHLITFLGHTLRVLVAVTGRQSTYQTTQLVTRAIAFLTSVPPRSITPVPHSAWVVAELRNTADVDKLLTQKLIINLRRTPNSLIVFRRIVKQSGRERVVEVKGLRHNAEIAEVKARLLEVGTTVIREDPPAASWSFEYRDRVVWKLEVQSTTWIVPTSVSLSQGHVQLLPSPICDLCHSDDHHRSRCGWEKRLYGTT